MTTPDSRFARLSRVRRVAAGALMLLGTVLVPHAAGADSWPAAVTLTRFSDDGRFFVRITPGKSLGDTWGFGGSQKGPYASARFYALQRDRSYRLVREVSLLNPVAPVDAIVSKHGYLVTFDNWHNLGFGKVLAVYDLRGKPIAAYELDELYPAERLGTIVRSVSSRYWRCAPHHFVDPAEQTQVYVREAQGGYFVLTVATGAVVYHPGHVKECSPPEVPRR
jgi:hypothetical protein